MDKIGWKDGQKNENEGWMEEFINELINEQI